MDNYNNTISESVINMTSHRRTRSYNYFSEPHHRILLFAKQGVNEYGGNYFTLESQGQKRTIAPLDENLYVVVINLLRMYGIRVIGYSFHEGGLAFVIPSKYAAILDRVFSN